MQIQVMKELIKQTIVDFKAAYIAQFPPVCGSGHDCDDYSPTLCTKSCPQMDKDMETFNGMLTKDMNGSAEE